VQDDVAVLGLHSGGSRFVLDAEVGALDVLVAMISCGRPSAMTRPKSSTITR